MGKITKIMLGLNIVAGIVGIVFGMGLKGDLKEAETAKNDALTKAADTGKNTSGLESANKQLKEQLGIAGQQFAAISNQWVAADAELATAKVERQTAENDLITAQTEAAKLQSQLTEATGFAQENTKLKTTLADYQALGTVEEVREWKKKATSKPKNPNGQGGQGGNSKPPKPKPQKGAEMGTIASFDPKFNFYVINRGADHGVKAGDVFNVVRAGNLVGKVKIKQTQPTVSIADAVKEFTRQQLQPGDKILKSN
tara:strand:+ start:152 stop:916 length:765 start_codon:yes stop_codon:yes gene_type:complete